MDAEMKDTTQFFLESWLSAAERQCGQFLQSVNEPYSDTFHKHRVFDEHYVLTATVMAVRFAKQLVGHAPTELTEHLEAFIGATKNAVEVRDMREHSDEYFLGKGRKNDQFFKGSSDGIRCDMSSSVKDGRGYMLGNLIAMESIQEECQQLLAHLRNHA